MDTNEDEGRRGGQAANTNEVDGWGGGCERGGGGCGLDFRAGQSDRSQELLPRGE